MTGIMTTAATIAAKNPPVDDEPDEVTAAKNIVLRTLPGPVNTKLGLASDIIENLLAAGIGIPPQIVDPHTGKPAVEPTVVIGSATAHAPTWFNGTTEQFVTIQNGFEYKDSYTTFRTAAVKVTDTYNFEDGVTRLAVLVMDEVNGDGEFIPAGRRLTISPAVAELRGFTGFVNQAAELAPYLLTAATAASIVE